MTFLLHRLQALVNIHTVIAFNGQEVTKGKYSAALARPQNFAIWQGFLSGLVTGTIYGASPLLCQLIGRALCSARCERAGNLIG